MIRVARHNEEPLEINADLIRTLESLPGPVVLLDPDGTVLVRLVERVNKRKAGRGARVEPGAVGAAGGS